MDLGGDRKGRDRGASAAHVRYRRPDRTDYDQRGFVNLAATACILALALALGWTAKTLDRQFALERCLDSGRKDCVRVVEQTPRTYVDLRK